MSVDVFGRTLVRAKEISQGPPGVGFVLTKEGDFDIEKHRLCNVAPAIESSDAVNLEALKTLEVKIDQLTNAIRFMEKQILVLNTAIPDNIQNQYGKKDHR